MKMLLRRMRPLMGCYIEVAIEARPDPEAAFACAFASLARSAALWSFQDPQSLLTRLNTGATVALDRDSERLLRLARALTRTSRGLFDCTVGGALVAAGRLPDHGGPAPLPRGRADDIEIRDGAARLARPIRLTLDGIAKGFAVDLAVEALRRHGVAAGLVNAGGDLRAFGSLEAPIDRRELDGRRTALGSLCGAAIASSRVEPGEHDRDAFPALVLGPTERPARPGIWTVLARRAWRADALTKVAACAPDGSRAELVAALGGLLVDPAQVPEAA
ncbi:FAD:protein FMN transferase [Roseateles sp. BYS180W]|uniref:FAD:protein FMN transferase n=1 Tax=Roseateles rivi TaxID=3299028 RepID=A0ABW7FZL2_9BURK